MDREEVMRLYIQANGWSPDLGETLDEVVRFANLVIQHKALDQVTALGQYEQGFDDGAAAEREKMITEGWRQCAVGQHTTQFCGQLEQAVADERNECANLAALWQNFDLATAIRARGNK